MNRKEILAKSREENAGGDERETQSIFKAGSIASGVGLLMCTFVVWMEGFFAPERFPSIWLVYLSMISANCFVKYHHLRRKRDLVFGVIFSVITVLYVVLFIKNLFW